ncbi:MAG TPA: ABC transporter substrate-binding protein [Burkholderiaceae bacterium]|nr:ABC transporter substrate-binding protein [Burkholderiaceae bacterium]
MPFLAAALNSTVKAQELRKPLRVGFLSAGGGPSQGISGPEPTNASARALLQGLRDLGYRYGPDVVLEGRSGEGRADHYAALARELVTANVDVIVAAGPTVEAVRRVTSRIPVVMVGGAMDPVEEKLVASLATPGGNITGITLQQVDLVGKRLELLRELVPGTAPIAVLWEDTSMGSWRAARSAAAAQGWQLLPFNTPDRAAIAPACASAKAAGAASLLVVSGALLFEHASEVVRAANANRLPAMYALRVYPDRGGLMSYGAELAVLYRRAAAFIDRIAKGSSPATMPIEQPTKFELVINMKAARALGLAIPQTLLLRADELIQ